MARAVNTKHNMLWGKRSAYFDPELKLGQGHTVIITAVGVGMQVDMIASVYSHSCR